MLDKKGNDMNKIAGGKIMPEDKSMNVLDLFSGI